MTEAMRFKSSPPLKRIARAYGTAGRQLTDWRPAWKALLPLIGPQQAAALESSGKLTGNGWPELSPRWAERKARAGKSRAAGYFTGKLQADLLANVGRRSISRLRFRWGPRAKYAYVFHHGVEGRQPPREFLGWTPELSTALFGILSGRADSVLAALAAEIGSSS